MSRVPGSVGLGVVGMGRHGSRYVKHLLDGVPGCHLAAVSRTDTAAGRAFTERHGVPFFADWRELVTRSEVEAVVAVTPPGLNRDICLSAARAGKPMLIEKPLALTVAEGREMVDAARAAGVLLMTAQTLRFTPVLERLRSSLPLIAPLEYLSLTMRAERPPHTWLDDPAQAGGGVLLEIGIHLLDLIRYLTGEEAVEAAGEMDRRHTARVEDLAQVRFRLASGLPCYVEVSRVSGGRVCRAEAVGQAGQLLADVDRSLLTRIEGRAIAAAESVPDRPAVVMVLEAFARSLMTGAPVPVSGEDGLRAVAMAEACYRAAREGRPVPVNRTA
ncbi:MAG: Gfo/Idh/MocA family oxidoreductase [Nitrospirae bacterium]|nr:MAG: Gfo/Idh/MocA family oxidoreductase [Nitrospirota bacterium]